MISIPDMVALVKKQIPDAEVSVMDRTGTQDHFMIHVVSSAFAGKNLLDRHRMVQSSLHEAMQDGRIHALEIKTAAADRPPPGK